MKTIAALLIFMTGTVLFLSVRLRRIRKQLSDMADALEDVRNGNGNRRILADPNQPTAPLAYEINDIVRAYENRLSQLRLTEKTNRRLMTSLSHDVRTPLTTLIGYLDAAVKGVVSGQEREDYFRTARRKAYDLKDYIDVLFDWFKLNSDEFVLALRPIETAELTRNILIDWIPIFESRGIAYTIEIPDEPVPAALDSDGYTRVLNNLIQNAVAHSRADYIGMRLVKRTHDLVFTLSDNGVGIEKDALAYIFTRLYKRERSHSDNGSGLGLSIARQLTEKMNGRISAESRVGEGTSFTLVFPLLQADALSEDCSRAEK